MNERRRTSDDEPEIEVRPLRKRRSGLAEEPIESGEILPPEERRSLIIRSQPRVEIVPDPRLAEPAPLPQAPPSRRTKYLWLVAAVLVASIGVVVPLASKPQVTDATEALQPTAKMIGATIDGDAHAAQSRVDAMAATPVLRAGIETDAQTLADLVRDRDLIFSVNEGEVVEVFRTANDKRVSMLRIPADGRALEPPPPGKTALEVSLEHGASVVASAKVAAGVEAEIALSVPIDLAPIRKRLADQVHEATLVGFALPVVIVKSSGKAGKPVTIPVQSSVDNEIALNAIVGVDTNASNLVVVHYAAFGLAGLLLVAFLVSLRRR